MDDDLKTKNAINYRHHHHTVRSVGAVVGRMYICIYYGALVLCAQAGEDIITLSVGEPDFAPHPAVIAATGEVRARGTRRRCGASPQKLHNPSDTHLATRRLQPRDTPNTHPLAALLSSATPSVVHEPGFPWMLVLDAFHKPTLKQRLMSRSLCHTVTSPVRLPHQAEGHTLQPGGGAGFEWRETVAHPGSFPPIVVVVRRPGRSRARRSQSRGHGDGNIW